MDEEWLEDAFPLDGPTEDVPPKSLPQQKVRPATDRPSTSDCRKNQKSATMYSCFKEAKKYCDDQNNSLLLELRKMNSTMQNILDELKEIKAKFN